MENTSTAHARAARLAALATKKKALRASKGNAGGLQFLKIDLDLGLTFAQIALNPNCGDQRRARNQANARKVYDTAVHWKGRLTISEPDTVEIDTKLRRLRSALEKLGERI